MGVFFLIPLYLSVALGLSAIATGVRIMPLSITLLAAALGIPRLFPDVSPRLVVRAGILAMLLGMLVLLGRDRRRRGSGDRDRAAAAVGLGIGALASQLGAVTVSAVPDDQSPEVGGVQNTVTNLGASLGTALAGSILIAVLTASFLTTSRRTPRSRRASKTRRTPSWPAASRSCPTSSSRPPPRKRARAPR